MIQNTRTDRLKAALRKAGVRLTRQRTALLDSLAKSDDHPDATTLHERTRILEPGISLSTVYRTLTALEEQGVIHKHVFQGEPARFEHAQTEHHDHMIDIDTGEVIEFTSEKIEKLQAEIAKEMGYEILHHRMELYVRRKS